MRIYSKLPIGEFAPVGKGHVFATANTKSGTLVLGVQIQIICMFSMWDLQQDGQHVGFYFESGFATVNKGGYLLTFMESKRGRATSARQVIRNDQEGLVVFDFDGAGAIAVSTKVSSLLHDILEAQ